MLFLSFRSMSHGLLGYTPGTMSIDALFPIAGNHAIQNAAFVIEWPPEAALSAANLQAVKALHGHFKDAFPVVQEHQSVTINFDAGQPNQEPVRTVDGLGAVHFIKPNPMLGPIAVTRAIQVSKTNAVIIIGDYSRWDTVWAAVSEWIEKLLPIILDGRPIAALNLQYNDRLNWRGDPNTFPLSEVLRRDSKYVPPNVFEVSPLWHSHHGYIEVRQQPIAHQLIDNINVNLVQENHQLALQIFTSHRGALTTPVWDIVAARDVLSALMRDFHERNKNVLKGLFTDEVCAKISLS